MVLLSFICNLLQIAGTIAIIYHVQTGNQNSRIGLIVFIMIGGLAAPLKLLDKKYRERSMSFVAAICGFTIFAIYSARLWT